MAHTIGHTDPTLGYDIYGSGYDVDATWGDLFAGEGWDTGEGGFAGEYESEEMYQYLEDNPWLQWGFGSEASATDAGWGTEGFTPGQDEEGYYSPTYWQYGDVDEDDPNVNLADLINEITGGQYGYEEIIGQGTMGMGAGTPGSQYDLFMEQFFEYDPETGEFVSRYDPQEFERPERQRLQLGQQKITGDIETSLGKYRGQTGRGLGATDLDISDIAAMTSGERGQLSAEYEQGIYESEQSYLEDVYGSVIEMSGDIGWDYDTLG
jgi:hypothetical protein